MQREVRVLHGKMENIKRSGVEIFNGYCVMPTLGGACAAFETLGLIDNKWLFTLTGWRLSGTDMRA
jgi:hypothetical protein